MTKKPSLIAAIEAGGTKFVCGTGSNPDDLRKIEFPATSAAETLRQAVSVIRDQAQDRAIQALGVASFGPIDLTPKMKAPLLGIFGNDDHNPTVAQVNQTEETLKRFGKAYEFHRYDGAGHGFFAVDRPAYRPEQAKDAWTKVFAFLAKHLGAPPPVR